MIPYQGLITYQENVNSQKITLSPTEEKCQLQLWLLPLIHISLLIIAGNLPSLACGLLSAKSANQPLILCFPHIISLMTSFLRRIGWGEGVTKHKSTEMVNIHNSYKFWRYPAQSSQVITSQTGQKLSKIEHKKEKIGRANGFLPSFSGRMPFFSFFLKVVAFFSRFFYGIPVA
jgi:hypothetical protein